MTVLICAGLLLFGCAKEGPVKPRLLRSMAELDQRYIPVLVFTDLHKQREAELAMQRYKEKWLIFYDDYHKLDLCYGENIVDKFWQEDFKRLNYLAASAEALIEQGELVAAHARLEEMRYIFKDMRHRHGLDYFLDGMTDFNNAMERMADILRGKDRLGERDLRRLKEIFEDAQNSLDGLTEARLNRELFRFDPEKVTAIKARVRQEQQALSALSLALVSRNADDIFQAVQDLQPNFVVLFKAFGDFQPIFDQMVKERDENKKEEVENETKNN